MIPKKLSFFFYSVCIFIEEISFLWITNFKTFFFTLGCLHIHETKAGKPTHSKYLNSKSFCNSFSFFELLMGNSCCALRDFKIVNLSLSSVLSRFPCTLLNLASNSYQSFIRVYDRK